MAEAKIAGLRAHYGIADPRTLTFWEIHRSLDEHHAAGERAALSSSKGEDRAAILRATDEAIDAWWGFLSAVDLSE